MGSMMKNVEAELTQMTYDETADLKDWLMAIRAELDNAALTGHMTESQAALRLEQIAEIEGLLLAIAARVEGLCAAAVG